MPTLRLTKRTIEALPFATTGQILYRDTELTGFGLRIGKRSKVYFVESQVRCRTVRTSIGRADVFSPEAARKKALLVLATMAEGRHPSDDREAGLAERITMEQAFAEFLLAKPQLAPRTVKDYSRTRDYLSPRLGGTSFIGDRSGNDPSAASLAHHRARWGHGQQRHAASAVGL
jgi:hypothetical protein